MGFLPWNRTNCWPYISSVLVTTDSNCTFSHIFCYPAQGNSYSEGKIRVIVFPQRELFYLFFEIIRVIIRVNSRYCCPYCWLPIEKVTAVTASIVVRYCWISFRILGTEQSKDHHTYRWDSTLKHRWKKILRHLKYSFFSIMLYHFRSISTCLVTKTIDNKNHSPETHGMESIYTIWMMPTLDKASLTIPLFPWRDNHRLELERWKTLGSIFNTKGVRMDEMQARWSVNCWTWIKCYFRML